MTCPSATAFSSRSYGFSVIFAAPAAAFALSASISFESTLYCDQPLIPGVYAAM